MTYVLICCSHMRYLVATVTRPTSGIYGGGKKSVFKNVVSGDPVFHSSAKAFCAPNADRVTVETSGCKSMVGLSVFNGQQCDCLESLRYSILSRKVSTAKTLVKPETNTLGNKLSFSTSLFTSHAV